MSGALFRLRCASIDLGCGDVSMSRTGRELILVDLTDDRISVRSR
jgi:hypothetical protein